MRRRRFDRKFPPPPPTPEGKVWARDLYGNTVLVDAQKLSDWCKKQIAHLDELPPKVRQRVYETGDVPDFETVQVNASVKSFGIALGRRK